MKKLCGTTISLLGSGLWLAVSQRRKLWQEVGCVSWTYPSEMRSALLNFCLMREELVSWSGLRRVCPDWRALVFPLNSQRKTFLFSKHYKIELGYEKHFVIEKTLTRFWYVIEKLPGPFRKGEIPPFSCTQFLEVYNTHNYYNLEGSQAVL